MSESGPEYVPESIFDFDVNKLNLDQVNGRRCIKCNSNWLNSSGAVPQVPAGISPNGTLMFICAHHVKYSWA
jgi:hypothetical protein